MPITMRLTLPILMASAVVIGCSREPQQGPHQFMRVEMIHESGTRPTDVSHLRAALLGVSITRFDADSSDCEKRLKRMDLKQLRIAVLAFNTMPSTPDFEYERAAAIRVQCVLSLPFDQECFEMVKSESEMLGSRESKINYMIAAGQSCVRSQPVGDALLFSAHDQ